MRFPTLSLSTAGISSFLSSGVVLRVMSLLLVAAGVSPATAWAQNYAERDASVLYFSDGDCDDPSDSCSLADAVRDATDGGASGNTVFVRLPVTGGIVTIEEDLIGAAEIDADVTLDTYLDDGGPTTGVQGFVAIEGDVLIDTGIVLTLVGNVELRLSGHPGRLELHDTAVIDGDGFIAFPFSGGEYVILLGDATIDCLTATPPNTAFINNMRVDVPIGEISIVDECFADGESDLFITNRLQVDVGTLEMGDNNLHITSLSEASGGDNPGVEIVGGATVRGSQRFFIEVEEPAEVPKGLAKTAGPVGFANTSDDCFVIEGAGELMMGLDKITDAGVCIDLEEIGAGGKSVNQAGALFVRNAVTVNGTFANHSLVGDVPEKGARTEFWKLETITVNLEVEGPGEEVDPTSSGFTNGTCETGALAVGNESGVYFFTAVEIQNDLILVDTDDLGTTGLNPRGDACIEGVWFMGDEDPDDAAPAKSGGPADHQTHSTIVGDFASHGGPNGIYLDGSGLTGSFVHNLAFEGDLLFDEAPDFVLADPADAYPRGDLCVPYTIEADGNKVLFTGSSDQLLKFSDDLEIASVQFMKTNTGDYVEIDEDSGVFIIDTTLELLRGAFRTNGKLDAEGTATVVINRDDDGSGVMQANNATRAYLSDDDDDIPRKVKYTGNLFHFSSHEIPGHHTGSSAGMELFLPELEVFMSDDNAYVLVGKDFTIGPHSKTGGKLIVTRGGLHLGTSDIRLANTLVVEIGDGEITNFGPFDTGEFDFPTQWIPNAPPDGFGRAFSVGEDGIDLLYFGTTDRTVGFEWPPSYTDVADRYEDKDVVRHVTIDPMCADDITISLRDDDKAYRLNGDLIIGDKGTLDANGNALEFNGIRLADLALTKTVNKTEPDYRTTVIFTLTVINNGPSGPSSATVEDAWPLGLVYLSHTGDGAFDPATFIWTTPDIGYLDTAQIMITATVKTVDPTTNTACITKTSLPDPHESNNCDDASITPVAADLALTKNLAGFSGDPVTNSITVPFKLTVTNNGPSDATGVFVEDPLPEGATLVSASAAYDVTTGIWTIGALKAGETVSNTLLLSADAANNLVNIAQVAGDQPDQDPSNNLAGSQAQHDPPDLDRFVADLSLMKTVSEERPSAGETITYTLGVKNNGPSSTAGVVVLDTLTAGLEFVRASFSDATDRYDPATGRWAVGQLKVGQTSTLVLEVRVVGTGEIVNTAEIIENHLPDRNGDNDIASATINVSSSAQAKATAVEDEAVVPEAFSLHQNYPNPFNPQTVIEYALPEAAQVRLVVYDMLGREVTVLVDGRLPAGRHEAVFEAGELPSGLYVYRLEGGGQTLTRYMLLLK